jgi:CBS domain containing-hemolysin-like protein
MSRELIIWFAFGACLGLSFLLSGMEAGVFALSRLRIRQHLRAGRRSAQVLHAYLENPETFLWTILVGNTVANLYILGWLVVLMHAALEHHRGWFILLFGIIVFLFYAFFDLLPKMLFRMYPTRLCIALARPFRGVDLALRPLVALLQWVSDLLLRWRGGRVFTGHLFGNREEFRMVMQESAQAFTSEERTMINRVLDLQNLTVRQAMAPLAQAVTVTAKHSASELLGLCREHKLTRLPVWSTDDSHTRIIGLVNLDSLLFQADLDPARRVGDLVKPALYLEEDLRLEVALRRMQRSGQRLAIVLSRDRREIGLLSLQDVLKTIFGEVSL